ELFFEASRLLEVVPEHLVELDEAAPVLVEPGRVSLVELGPPCSRPRFVGGIPAEEVTEAERLLAREERGVGTDQLLPHECGQAGCRFGLIRVEGSNRSLVKRPALDRAALEDVSLP